MANSKSQSPKTGGTLGARLLIILFAAGLVVLGAYPIRRDIRGAAGKARSYFHEHFPILAGTDRGGTESADSKAKARASLYRSDETGALVIDTQDLPQPTRPKGITLDKKAGEKHELDRLSQTDKKELSDLVNGF